MNAVAPNLKSKLKSPPRAAEERASDLERRRELGQFFTPVGVTGFIWDVLEVIHGSPFPAHTRLIDPACGDGVFLRVAHERGGLRPDCLFGTDIDEMLVPAWRRDPLLGGANVHLANGLLDEPALGIREGTFDILAGNPPFSGKGLRELLRLLEDPAGTEHHEEMDLFEATWLKEEPAALRQPLTRQERKELDRQVRILSQYACWRLNAAPEEEEETDAAPAGPSTDFFAGMILSDRNRTTISDLERAAHLIAHWPLDRPLEAARPEIRDVIRRLASTAIEVFFTERFLRLARPGGLIAVIVPESIVASDRLGPLRRWLAGRMDLLASVGLPQKVFTGVGANARTTILFARRRIQERPDGWAAQDPDHLPDTDRMIYLTAPRLDAPHWSLESYLESVLEGARSHRNDFQPDTQ